MIARDKLVVGAIISWSSTLPDTPFIESNQAWHNKEIYRIIDIKPDYNGLNSPYVRVNLAGYYGVRNVYNYDLNIGDRSLKLVKQGSREDAIIYKIKYLDTKFRNRKASVS